MIGRPSPLREAYINLTDNETEKGLHMLLACLTQMDTVLTAQRPGLPDEIRRISFMSNTLPHFHPGPCTSAVAARRPRPAYRQF